MKYISSFFMMKDESYKKKIANQGGKTSPPQAFGFLL